MDRQQRERLLYWGAPLALGPALAFLPAIVHLVIEPAMRHATAWAVVLFPLLAIGEYLGLSRLVRCCVGRPLDFVAMLAYGVIMVLLVIVTYTGLFLALLAGLR